MAQPERSAIVLRISPELAQALADHAKEAGVSRNDLMSDILRGWLRGEHTKVEALRVANAARDAILAAMGVE